jgi:hypothetical protein
MSTTWHWCIWFENPMFLAKSHGGYFFLLEYDFTIIHKLSKSHFIVDAFSHLPHNMKLQGVPNQMKDATLFRVQPYWL